MQMATDRATLDGFCFGVVYELNKEQNQIGKPEVTWSQHA